MCGDLLISNCNMDLQGPEWGEHTDVTFYRQPSVFLNGCLHIMGHSGEYSMILVDMEGNTWRSIDRPSGF
jgi:hypothetical protein